MAYKDDNDHAYLDDPEVGEYSCKGLGDITFNSGEDNTSESALRLIGISYSQATLISYDGQMLPPREKISREVAEKMEAFLATFTSTDKLTGEAIGDEIDKAVVYDNSAQDRSSA
jgi:hypothetical protein